MIPYGRKTENIWLSLEKKFEGSVIPYGRKTMKEFELKQVKFEGSVIPYGRKTKNYAGKYLN